MIYSYAAHWVPNGAPLSKRTHPVGTRPIGRVFEFLRTHPMGIQWVAKDPVGPLGPLLGPGSWVFYKVLGSLLCPLLGLRSYRGLINKIRVYINFYRFILKFIKNIQREVFINLSSLGISLILLSQIFLFISIGLPPYNYNLT